MAQGTTTTGDLLGFIRRAGTGRAFTRTLAGMCRYIGMDLGARRVSVYLREGDRLVPVVAEFPSGSEDPGLFTRWRQRDLRLHAELTRLLDGRAEVLVVERPRELYPEAFAEGIDPHPFAALPLLGEEGQLGVLIVEGDEATLAEARERAEAIGGFVTLAVETARMAGREQARAEEASALLEVAEALKESMDLTTVLSAVARTTARVTGFERGSIFLLDASGRLLPHMSQFADGHAEPESWQRFRSTTTDLPAARRAMELGEPLIYEDPGAVPDEIPPEWWEPFGIQTMLILPLAAQGRTFGVLVLDHRRRHSIGPRTVRIARAVAAQGAVAIGGARLLEQERESRRRAHAASRALAARAEQQAAVARLGQAALRLDLDEFIDEAVRVVADNLAVPLTKLLELGPDGLLLRAGVGWRAGLVGTVVVPADTGSQAGYTLGSAEPVIVADLASETRFEGPELLLSHGVVSGMSVVVGGRERPYGVLGAHSTTAREFNADDVHFLQAVANVIGSAVERHAMDVALRRSRHRFRSILETASDAIVSVEAERRIVLFNRQAEVVFGCRRDEAIGRPFEMLLDGDDARSIVEALFDEVDTETPVRRHDVRARRRGGEVFPAAMTISRLELDGEITYTAIVRDMTEARRNQERLEQLARSKDELIASVSHELRTPLTGMLGFLELLRDRPEDFTSDERQAMVEAAAREAADLANIVEDLLTAARADIGTLRVSTASVDLRAQARQVLEMRDLVGDVPVHGPPVVAVGDPIRVRQILRNLVTNAIRYGGRRVEVRTARRPGGVSVAVLDDGPGVAPEDRARMFEPYERSARHPGVPGSVGLGLTVSRNLARLMGGDLVYRHEDGWSTFELVLPTAEGDDEAGSDDGSSSPTTARRAEPA